MTTKLQQSPYLRQQRDFPSDDIQKLTVEIDRSYVDTAIKVNSRTIGIFAVGFPLVTGESWYISGQTNKQQTFRQLYTFTSAGSILHHIDFTQITGFTRIYGTFTDGTNWYPLPYVDVVAASNQVNIVITPTNIVITAGAGAPPAITNGFVILEWLSKF